MKIQLVSYTISSEKVHGKHSRLAQSAKLLKESAADLVVFSGWPLGTSKDIEAFAEAIKGTKAAAVIDVKMGKGHNRLFLVQNGRLVDMRSEQILFDSIDGNDPEKCERFLNDLRNHRMIMVNGKKVLVMLCGENNVVINKAPYSTDYHVEFRLKDEKLKRSFEDILKQADIVINPTHSLNSRLGLYYQRAEYFSKNAVFCCVANNDNLHVESLQLVYRNAKRVSLPEAREEDTYIERTITI